MNIDVQANQVNKRFHGHKSDIRKIAASNTGQKPKNIDSPQEAKQVVDLITGKNVPFFIAEDMLRNMLGIELVMAPLSDGKKEEIISSIKMNMPLHMRRSFGPEALAAARKNIALMKKCLHAPYCDFDPQQYAAIEKDMKKLGAALYDVDVAKAYLEYLVLSNNALIEHPLIPPRQFYTWYHFFLYLLPSTLKKNDSFIDNANEVAARNLILIDKWRDWKKVSYKLSEISTNNLPVVDTPSPQSDEGIKEKDMGPVLKDPQSIINAMEKDLKSIQYVDESILNDPDFRAFYLILYAARHISWGTKYDSVFQWPDYTYLMDGSTEVFFKEDNRVIVYGDTEEYLKKLQVLKNNLFEYTRKRLQVSNSPFFADKSFVGSLIAIGYSFIDEVPEKYLYSKSTILKVIEMNDIEFYRLFDWIDDNSPSQIPWRSLKRYVTNIPIIYRADKELTLKMISVVPGELAKIDDPLIRDDAFILSILQSDPNLYVYLPGKLKTSKKIILFVLEQKSFLSIYDIPVEMTKDIEIKPLYDKRYNEYNDSLENHVNPTIMKMELIKPWMLKNGLEF